MRTRLTPPPMATLAFTTALLVGHSGDVFAQNRNRALTIWPEGPSVSQINTPRGFDPVRAVGAGYLENGGWQNLLPPAPTTTQNTNDLTNPMPRPSPQPIRYPYPNGQNSKGPAILPFGTFPKPGPVINGGPPVINGGYPPNTGPAHTNMLIL
jgi:hypothetical protein